MRLIVLPLLVFLTLAGIACAGDDEPTPGLVDQISFELDPGVHGHLFSLEAGAELELEFRSDSEVDLRLLDPEGRELGSWERVIHVDKQLFEVESAGQHKLEIDNSSPGSAPTSVTITMQVFPPNGG